MFAQVFLDANTSAIDSVYDYKIPEDLSGFIKPGMRVVVPFGAGNRRYQAMVVSLSETTAFDEKKIKQIETVLDIEPVVPLYLIETAVFLRNRYFCTYSEALNTVLPSLDKIKRLVVYKALDFDGELTEEQRVAYEVIQKKDGVDFTGIKLKIKSDAAKLKVTLSELIEAGAIQTDEIFDAQYHTNEDIYVEFLQRQRPIEEVLCVISPRAEKQRAVINLLYSATEPLKRTDVYAKAKATAATLEPLAAKGLIRLVKKTRSYDSDNKDIKADLPLTAAQIKVVEKFRTDTQNGTDSFLLFGVTGSGKTRVFFEMFDDILAKGQQCLLLVPEIALTPQMMRLVSERFSCPVAIMHSKLSVAERYAEFLKIKHGTAKIVLGARSALFMPFKNLGIIVVDEEHETSYKSSQSPRYDAIETARYICELTKSKLVLSSATPSIETYYRAMRGEYEILRLPNRVNDIPMPYISITDMRRELKSGNRSPISNILREKIEQRLTNGEQSLLFLNRRGFNTYVFCRSCGYIEMCPNCDVSLTFHKESNSLRCHYCGHTKPTPSICPECGSDKIKFMGTGTEKIQQYVSEIFPQARIMRLDSDIARSKDAYERILNDFAAGKADILIGTQMIVKGLDFANVTLTGILLADAALNFPDINAAARTYQLTSQAAGRSGRRQTPGQVIIQTYTPASPVLVYCAANDYEGFYAYDIAHRKEMSYPPFTEIIGIFTANADLAECEKDSICVAKEVKSLINRWGYDTIKQYEPAPAFIQKLKNKYIYHTLVCYPAESDFPLRLREAYESIKKKIHSTIFVEIDPITLL